MIAETLSQKVIRNTLYNALSSLVSVVALIILVPYIMRYGNRRSKYKPHE